MSAESKSGCGSRWRTCQQLYDYLRTRELVKETEEILAGTYQGHVYTVADLEDEDEDDEDDEE